MPARRKVLISFGVAGFLIVTAALVALPLRRAGYRRALEAQLSDRLGMHLTVRSVDRALANTHRLSDVRVRLPGDGTQVFAAAKAIWARRGNGDAATYALDLTDGWLLVGAAGWTRDQYDAMLAGGLGHDFATIGLSEVRLKNIDLRFSHPQIAFAAGGTSGVVFFDGEGVGQAMLNAYRLGGVKVDDPVNITGRFIPGKTLLVHEVRLEVPTLPLAAFGFEGLWREPPATGSFRGTIRYRQTTDGEVVDITGSLSDAELQPLTASVLDRPLRGRIDLDVDSGVIRDERLKLLAGRGHLRDVRIADLLPGVEDSETGTLNLDIEELRCSDERLDYLSAQGRCDDVPLDAVSALVGPGKVTGNLSMDIRSLLIVDDRIEGADITVESTAPPGEAGVIDRTVLAKLAKSWMNLEIDRLLPPQVTYTRLGARLIAEDGELRVLGTHGPQGRTILTVQLLGRPLGIIRQPPRPFPMPDILAILRERAKEVDPDRIREWWERHAP